MKILTLDIESAPSKIYRWQLYGNDTTSVSQIVEPGHLLCVAMKWHDSDEVEFFYGPRYETKCEPWNYGVTMVHEAIDQADVVVTYNGKKYDIPKLNAAFLEAGLGPPQPYQHIDLYNVIKKTFDWPKMSLEFVSQKLLGTGKVPHEGFDLWVKCMNGDPEAWVKMQEYNKGDVIITEELYDHVRTWIPNHPNALLYGEDPSRKACTRCGSEHIQKRGTRVASTRIYQQYQCMDCGGWFRETRSSNGATVTG